MEKTHENWAEPERQDDEEMFGTLDNYEPKKKSQRLSDDEDDFTAARYTTLTNNRKHSVYIVRFFLFYSHSYRQWCSTSGAQSTMRQADLPAHSSSSVMVETENQMDLSVASTSCANESQPQAGCSYTSEPGRKRPHPERQYRQRTASNTSSNDDEPVVVEADVPVAIENDDECSSGSIELMSETTVSLGSPVSKCVKLLPAFIRVVTNDWVTFTGNRVAVNIFQYTNATIINTVSDVGRLGSS